ncbi:MAG: hypothetical protein ACI4FO_03150 [Acutalibacteraceae bacterium]
MDYIKMILTVLNRIKNESTLKKIYDYACFLYSRESQTPNTP